MVIKINKIIVGDTGGTIMCVVSGRNTEEGSSKISSSKISSRIRGNRNEHVDKKSVRKMKTIFARK
jgi:hypothetical protein